MGDQTQLLSVKELAWRLNSHSDYVYLMRKAGLPMPGNRTTLEEALAWLESTPTGGEAWGIERPYFQRGD